MMEIRSPQYTERVFAEDELKPAYTPCIGTRNAASKAKLLNEYMLSMGEQVSDH